MTRVFRNTACIWAAILCTIVLVEAPVLQTATLG